MSSFANKAKSFMVGAAMVPAYILAGGALAASGGLTDDEVYSNTFSWSHAFECAFSLNTPDSHKQYHVGATNHGMDASADIPYVAPWFTYPAMLGLGLLGVRRRWYETLSEKIR